MVLMLHDFWINAFEEENPNLIPYYHEWFKGDKVELIDTIPLLKVNVNLYNYLEYGQRKVPGEILNRIINKAYLRKDQKREQIKFAFIFTDSARVFMVRCDSYGRVEKKSRLIPRQEALVLEMTDGLDNDYILESKVNISKYEPYYGLTRNEKHIQNKTTEFINSIHPSRLTLLKYLIAEFDLLLHKKLTGTFEEIKNRFIEVIKNSEINKLVELNKVIDKLMIIN